MAENNPETELDKLQESVHALAEALSKLPDIASTKSTRGIYGTRIPPIY